jgi:hypothetical protein
LVKNSKAASSFCSAASMGLAACFHPWFWVAAPNWSVPSLQKLCQ